MKRSTALSHTALVHPRLLHLGMLAALVGFQTVACNSEPSGTAGSGGSGSSGGAKSPDGGSSSGHAGGAAHIGGASSTGGVATPGGASSGGRAGTPGGGQAGGGSSDGGAPVDGSGGREGTGAADVVLDGVRWVGRVDDADTGPRFSWSGSGFIAKISGTGLKATLANDSDKYGLLFRVVIDGKPSPAFTMPNGEATIPLAEGLAPGEHTIEFYRQTEGQNGNSTLRKLEVVDGQLMAPPPGPGAILEVIGDSITCGFGDLGADESCGFTIETESHFDSYSAVAGRALGVDVHTIAISGHGVIRNYDTTTIDLLPDAYDRTIMNETAPSWTPPLSPKVIVINLGTNDFAQGDPGVEFEDGYWAFLSDLRDRHPEAYLLATLGPMLDGYKLDGARTYVQNAVAAFEADGNEGKVGFLEYTVQVQGELGCNWHPNVKKHKSMADALVAKLRELKLY